MRAPAEACACGARFSQFRTGLTFASVRALMWRSEAEQWRSKSRRAVLGFWHEMKVQMWESMHGGCTLAAEIGRAA